MATTNYNTPVDYNFTVDYNGSEMVEEDKVQRAPFPPSFRKHKRPIPKPLFAKETQLWWEERRREDEELLIALS